jgi:hypothetical protein
MIKIYVDAPRCPKCDSVFQWDSVSVNEDGTAIEIWCWCEKCHKPVDVLIRKQIRKDKANVCNERTTE